MVKKYQMKLINLMVIVPALLFCACNSRPAHSFDVRATLADHKILNMTVEVEYKDEAGITMLKNKIDRVRYALVLVFSRLKADDLQNNGKYRTKASIRKILNATVKEKVMGIRLLNFSIHEM